jgi:hypothetical protein
MSLFDILDQILQDISGSAGHTGPLGDGLAGDPASVPAPAPGGQQALDEIARVNPGAAGVLSSTNTALRDAWTVAHGSPDDPHVAETLERMNARSSRMIAMLQGQNAADQIRQSVSESHQALLDRNAAHQAIMDSNSAEVHGDAVVTAGERLIDSVKSLLGWRS